MPVSLQSWKEKCLWMSLELNNTWCLLFDIASEGVSYDLCCMVGLHCPLLRSVFRACESCRLLMAAKTAYLTKITVILLIFAIWHASLCTRALVSLSTNSYPSIFFSSVYHLNLLIHWESLQHFSYLMFTVGIVISCHLPSTTRWTGVFCFFFSFCSGAWITALVCKWSYWQVAGNVQNKRYRDSERWSLTWVIRVYEFYKPWLSDSDIIRSPADPRWVWYFGLFSRIPDERRLQHHIFSDPGALLCK